MKTSFTIIKKSATMLACGMFFVLSVNAQLADPQDYSDAQPVILNGDDLSGRYVIKLADVAEDLYMSPMISPEEDYSAYATDDVTNCYAFDITKNGEFYTLQCGDSYMVYDKTNGWLFEVTSADEVAGGGANINFSLALNADNTVTIEKGQWPGNFLKYEINGIVERMKFYTNGGADEMVNYSLLRVDGDVTSIDVEKMHSIKVYPNPTSNVISVANISGASTIVVRNMIGQSVYNTVASSDIEIPVNDWVSGVYLVHVDEVCYKIVVR